MDRPAFVRPTPTKDQIIHAARAFGVDHVTDVRELGGLPNATYRVTGSSKTIAVRFCNDRYTSEAHLAAEVQALRHLTARRVSVTPQLVASRESRFIEVVDGTRVLATRFIEGTRVDRIRGPELPYRQVGHATGVLTSGLRHLDLNLPPTESFVARSRRLLECLPSVARQLGWPIDCRTVMQAWEMYEESSSSIEQTIVHTDVWPENLILDKDGKVWIVDLDDLAEGPPQLDIASALSELAVARWGAIETEPLNLLLIGYGESDQTGLQQLSPVTLLDAVLGLYASWIACDAMHGKAYDNVTNYYHQLELLTTWPARPRALRVFERSLDEARTMTG